MTWPTAISEVERALSARESGTIIRSRKQTVHAAIAGEKKTMCGWRYWRDVAWSIQLDSAEVTCEKCVRVSRQREEAGERESASKRNVIKERARRAACETDGEDAKCGGDGVVVECTSA